MEATLGPIIFPRDRNLRQLYAHTCLYPFHCAIIALPLYKQIQFQECGVRRTWGASKSMAKDDAMTQVRCTPVPELMQNIVWNTPLLSCSWKPPRYGGRSDIMFLKPNWSPLRGLIYAHLTSTLRCHWDCGAHDHVQGVVPMLSIASQCIHVTIPLPLNPFHPVTLFSSERRLYSCACFKHT